MPVAVFQTSESRRLSRWVSRFRNVYWVMIGPPKKKQEDLSEQFFYHSSCKFTSRVFVITLASRSFANDSRADGQTRLKQASCRQHKKNCKAILHHQQLPAPAFVTSPLVCGYPHILMFQRYTVETSVVGAVAHAI